MLQGEQPKKNDSVRSGKDKLREKMARKRRSVFAHGKEKGRGGRRRQSKSAEESWKTEKNDDHTRCRGSRVTRKARRREARGIGEGRRRMGRGCGRKTRWVGTARGKDARFLLCETERRLQACIGWSAGLVESFASPASLRVPHTHKPTSARTRGGDGAHLIGLLPVGLVANGWVPLVGGLAWGMFSGEGMAVPTD